MDWDLFQSYPILLKYATETKISFGEVNHSSKTFDLALFRFLFDFLWRCPAEKWNRQPKLQL